MEKTRILHPNSSYAINVPSDQEPIRIDSFLATQFSSYSRTFFARLIDKNLIALNGITLTKQSIVVRPHDVITITSPIRTTLEQPKLSAKDLGISILFEHEHFLIINKPANLIMHKPSSFSESITVADWLVATFDTLPNVGSVERPGIVHRLDKDTSGLLVIAKTNYAHMVFGAMFKDRSIEKKYLAIVQGHPEKSGIINLAIGRHPITRNKMSSFPEHTVTRNATHNGNGIRAAQSHYRVLRYFDNYSLLEVKPLTGRTHQIRVHCAAIGYPILGDALYGKKSLLIGRQALHAYSISFRFDDKDYSFTQEPPADFNQLIHKDVHEKNNA